MVSSVLSWGTQKPQTNKWNKTNSSAKPENTTGRDGVIGSLNIIPPTSRQAVGDDIEPTMWTDALRRSSSPHGRTLIHSAVDPNQLDQPEFLQIRVLDGCTLIQNGFKLLWFLQYLSNFSKTKVNKFILQSIQRSGLMQKPKHIFWVFNWNVHCAHWWM